MLKTSKILVAYCPEALTKFKDPETNSAAYDLFQKHYSRKILLSQAIALTLHDLRAANYDMTPATPEKFSIPPSVPRRKKEEPPALFSYEELKYSSVQPDLKSDPWFSGSKVVDAQGNPLVVYHGTDKTFRKFNLKKTTQGIIWFTSDRSAVEAGEVGAQGKGIIMELYASIKKPAGWKEYDRYGIGELKRDFDGVLLPEKDGTFTGIAFHPDQLRIVKRTKK